MPGLDPAIGKEAPVLFLVLSFFIVFGYLGIQVAGKAVAFVNERDKAFLDALEKLSTDLQREQAERDKSHEKFMEEQNAMWRGFVKDQWGVMAKSLDTVAEQLAQLGSKIDQHDQRTMLQHDRKDKPTRT